MYISDRCELSVVLENLESKVQLKVTKIATDLGLKITHISKFTSIRGDFNSASSAMFELNKLLDALKKINLSPKRYSLKDVLVSFVEDPVTLMLTA